MPNEERDHLSIELVDEWAHLTDEQREAEMRIIQQRALRVRERMRMGNAFLPPMPRPDMGKQTGESASQ